MTLEFNVNKSTGDVFEYLSDMQKFVSVHPIIYKIDQLSPDNYLVSEKLKFLFIPWNFTYIIKLNTNKENKEVIITTTVKKMVDIKMHFVLEEVSGNSFVKETVTFKSFLPVKTIMSKIFSEQHTQLFLNIGKA